MNDFTLLGNIRLASDARTKVGNVKHGGLFLSHRSFLAGLIYFLILTVASLCVSGCGRMSNVSSKLKVKKKAQLNQEKEFNKVEDPHLAKLILKGQKPKLDVSEDPFRPLLSKEAYASTEGLTANILRDIKFIGIMKLNNQYSALLKFKSEKGVYQVDDKVYDFTIVNINEAEIELSDGTKTITLKRGE